MACTSHVAWDDRLTGYDFGLFAAEGVSVERQAPATDAELGLVHIQPYIAAVRRASGPEPDASVLEFGVGNEDNPAFAGMRGVRGAAGPVGLCEEADGVRAGPQGRGGAAAAVQVHGAPGDACAVARAAAAAPDG